MTRFISKVACLLALPGAAMAQEWTARTSANGSLLFGSATAPGGSLYVACTAPAPENVPLIETGSHESHRTGPFEIIIGFSDDLFEWAPPYSIEGASLIVGDVAYGLPAIGLDELSGTAVYLPMTDPLIAALYEAPSLRLNTGQGVAYDYPIENIGPAMVAGLGYCVDRYVAMGQPLPQGLERYVTALAPQTAASPMRSAALAATQEACEGPANVSPWALLEQDIDGDGITDVLLDWGGVSCVTPTAATASRGVGQCGMENCLIEFYISSTYVAGSPPDGMLAMGAQAVAGQPSDIRFGGASGVCRQLGLDVGCSTLQRWTGTGFQYIPE